MKLFHVAEGIESALPGFVDISEHAVLPQDRGEVRRLPEVRIRYILHCLEIRLRKSVDADQPDEAANILLHIPDIGLGAGEHLRIIVPGGVLRHHVGGNVVGALGELGITEPLGAAANYVGQRRRRQALVTGVLLSEHLLGELIAERDDVPRDQPCMAEQVVLNSPAAIWPWPVAVDP